MATKLFVGSLSFNVDNDKLKELFDQFGTVVSANVITDRDSGNSKGFGFVEMETDQEAQAAITGLNGKEVDGRIIAVNIARPKEDRPARPGFNNRRRY
jgi:RNA recognition motif-containing protein